jgi:hypothetical protein
LSYKNEAIWKQRLAVSDDNRAYLFLLTTDGHIRWSNSAAFTEPDYQRLGNELETLLWRTPKRFVNLSPNRSVTAGPCRRHRHEGSRSRNPLNLHTFFSRSGLKLNAQD